MNQIDEGLKILIIDDNPSIHQDFIKILKTVNSSDDLDKLDSELFGETATSSNISLPKFKISTATQGQEGVEKIRKALEENSPFALAFVDIRMPPGWDGIETIKHIWALDPNMQIVICTAYSDYTWEETVENLGMTHNLLILKKPFDNVTVRQLTCALVKKWQLMHDIKAHTDFLERNIQQRTQSLQESLSLIRATIESSTDGILVVSSDNKIVHYNNQFVKMWEIPPAVINTKDNNVVVEYLLTQLQAPEEFITKTNQINKTDDISIDTIIFKDGRIFERYSQPHRLGNTTVGRVWSFRDITKRYYLEQKLEYQATHDALTDLPNRVLFHDRLKQGISAAARNHTKVGILFIDLNRFKLVNDSLSHAVGDELLKAVSKRLKSVVRAEDTLARLGGDEFVAVITGLKKDDDIFTVANKFMDAFKAPFKVSDQTLYMSASIGISLYPDDGDNIDELLRNADVAMYQAKGSGTNQFNFYMKDMNQNILSRLELESDIRAALQNDEFFLTYQAQQDSITGEVFAAEALIRWDHPKKGILLPIDFIPQAEAAGLIVDIGEWVIKTACKQNKIWQENGLPPVRVAVNVTSQQLRQSGFVELVKKTLAETQLDPSHLEIEVTENVIISGTDIIRTLQSLRESGIKVALDDFGTGNSSLTYLRKSSIDSLKIDKSFVENIEENKNDEVIIKSIIAMAQSLDLEVVAEGVETNNQLNFLQREHCKNVQGYYFSKPLVASDFINLLKSKGVSKKINLKNRDALNIISNTQNKTAN